MKKVIFTVLVCLGISGVASAQFKQGNLVVSGKTGLSLSAMSSKAKADGSSVKLGNTTAFSFSPGAGYFVIDNLAVGLSLDASTESMKQDFAGEELVTTSTAISVGPFARYYLPAGLYGELALAVGSQTDKEKFDGDTEEEKYGLFGWSLSAGYAAMIKDNIAIEPSIGYGSVAMKPDGGDGKLVNSGLIINVGVSLYISR